MGTSVAAQSSGNKFIHFFPKIKNMIFELRASSNIPHCYMPQKQNVEQQEMSFLIHPWPSFALFCSYPPHQNRIRCDTIYGTGSLTFQRYISYDLDDKLVVSQTGWSYVYKYVACQAKKFPLHFFSRSPNPHVQ